MGKLAKRCTQGGICLDGALQAWGTPAFNAALKRAIESLDPALLPLQEGLSQSSHAVLDKPPGARILGAEEGAGYVRARVGLLYAGIIAGCNCADDPTPVDEITEYCEVEFEIDKRTGEATVTLVED